ncbi:ATP-binding protein [Lentzea sp. JNUCC 0626]|uniref:ATP-binding protein n=1 Tax=Lentzea sp. JNUCC 0626 TaxID=3367513 RepID=UPI003749AC2E
MEENTVSGAVVRAEQRLHLASPADAVVPRQLPAAVGNFSGRLDEIAELEAGANSGAVVISALNGTAGVGKTALALHWAHRIADQFPDGQLYVNMRGFEPEREPMAPDEAIRGFLDAFGVPSDAMPMSLDGQAALFRSKVAKRQVLVVLDNVNNADQVRPLLPGSRSCFVLITSRNRLAGLVAEHDAKPLRLDRLTPAESATLLKARLGEVDPAALAEVADLCAGLPLALAIVAARVAQQPHIPISEVVTELREDRLEALDLGDYDLSARSVFSWSVRALSEPAARMFRLLGLHPGPDIDLLAAASLAATSAVQCRKWLRELVAANLLDEYVAGRFRFHDLLRLFAREQAGSDDDAQRRLLDFYLHSAWAGDRALVSQRIGIDLPEPDPQVVPLTFAGPADAARWFTAEHAVLVGLVGHAAEAGFDGHAWRLAMALRSYLDTQGHWRGYESVYRAAIPSVNRLADLLVQARVHRGLGRALSRLGSWPEADEMLRQALLFTQMAGDRRQEAQCHEALSWLYSERSEHDQALKHALSALALHPTDGDSAWRGYSLNIVGRCYAAVNLPVEALRYSAEALELHQGCEVRDETGEAEALNTISHIRFLSCEYPLAMGYAEEALALHRQISNRPGEAEALERIGDAELAQGRSGEARIAWEKALVILEELQRPTLAEVRRKLANLKTLNQPRSV